MPSLIDPLTPPKSSIMRSGIKNQHVDNSKGFHMKVSSKYDFGCFLKIILGAFLGTQLRTACMRNINNETFPIVILQLEVKKYQSCTTCTNRTRQIRNIRAEIDGDLQLPAPMSLLIHITSIQTVGSRLCRSLFRARERIFVTHLYQCPSPFADCRHHNSPCQDRGIRSRLRTCEIKALPVIF